MTAGPHPREGQKPKKAKTMTTVNSVPRNLTLLVPLLALMAWPAGAQTPSGAKPAAPTTTAQPAPPATAKPAPAAPGTTKPVATPAGVTVPADYVIGPDDVLAVIFWREKDLSTDVVVRPDGRISIPVIQDIEAAGMTPEQLRERLTKQAERYVEEPNVTVVVKQINSRRVFITGMVTKPGPYNLNAPMSVLQLISTAGGLLEYADAKNIMVMRTENGAPTSFKFNYREIAEGKNLKQNIMLKPGDTVIVP